MGSSVDKYRRNLAAAITAAAVAWTAATPLCAQAQAQAAAPASSPTSPPSALPFKKEEPSDAPVRLMLAWAVVLLVAAAGAGYFAMLRSGRLGKGAVAWGRHPNELLRRGGSLPLSQNASVHVVQWGGDEYLLGSTPQGVTLLDKRPLQRAAETPDERGRSE